MSYSDLVINTLKVRAEWYQESLYIAAGIKPRPNGYDFPTSTNGPFSTEAMWEWRGAIREIQNTIDMLRHK